MNLARIHHLQAREILDSRGHPTVEATVQLSNGDSGTASVPSGASTGQFEAWELRDGDPRRYNGQGVLTACQNVGEKIFPILRGMRVTEHEAIDARMIEFDGTPNKAKLGANAILAVSLACARAGAAASEQPLYSYLRTAFELPIEDFRLPHPMFNVLNGGRHADNGLDFQEYMLVPDGRTFAEQLRLGSEVTGALRELLAERGLSTLVGDEGGFAPAFHSNREPLELLAEAIGATPYSLGKDLHLALDVAASEFFTPADRQYVLRCDHTTMSAQELVGYLEKIAQDFPLRSIEDGLAEVDEAGWLELTRRLRSKLMVVGDDLFATSAPRLLAGRAKDMANAIIIKPNQVGTLTETMETIKTALAEKYTPIISHRSGETIDTFIADLAVAVNAPFIKAGSVIRGERLAKYNRLLAIEAELA